MKTNRNRQIDILIVFFLLTTARASGNWANRTVPRVQHAYYAHPQYRSCESFSRPYARSMCIELQRIHRSSWQPLFSPPPPPTEIDQRYIDQLGMTSNKVFCRQALVGGNYAPYTTVLWAQEYFESHSQYNKREQRVNPVPMGPAVDHWKETKIGKTRKKYEKQNEKIVSWEDKKKKKAKRKLHRTERSVEKTKMKAMVRFRDENERIGIIVASARAHAYESRMNLELKVKEKANLMRTTAMKPSTCL